MSSGPPGEAALHVGRFAPSPTGPLHFGSLVAAAGSWLAARASGGRWLVRIEDLDAPRVVPGSEQQILDALRRFGLEWDGEIVRQSARAHLYERALSLLGGRTYPCACSRADVQRAASAQHEAEPVYPGTCRDGLHGREARATRFRAPAEDLEFDDLVRGRVRQNAGGDFIVKRADGPFAYQLAVVVDDAEQGISHIIRGGDLLGSTARQIALYEALGHQVPQFGHLPLVVGPDGVKLGKRYGSLALSGDPLPPLRAALTALGIDADGSTPSGLLASALANFDFSRLTDRTTVVHNPPKQP